MTLKPTNQRVTVVIAGTEESYPATLMEDDEGGLLVPLPLTGAAIAAECAAQGYDVLGVERKQREEIDRAQLQKARNKRARKAVRGVR